MNKTETLNYARTLLSMVEGAINSKPVADNTLDSLANIVGFYLTFFTLSEDESRSLFEERMFSRYFISHIKVVQHKQFWEQKSGMLPKAEFVARDTDGNYVRDELNAMWFSWQRLVGTDPQFFKSIRERRQTAT